MNNKGISLSEILISIVVLSLLSLGAAELIKNISSKERNIERNTEASQFTNYLSKWLSQDTVCTKNFVDTNFTLGYGSAPVESQLVNFSGYNNSNTTILRRGTNVGKGLTISSLTIQPLPAETLANTTRADFSGTILRRRTMLISMEFDVALRGVIQKKSWKFELPVLTSTTNRVTVCNNQLGPEMSCAAIQGIWNVATQKCEPGKFCKHMGSYITRSCSDGLNVCSSDGVQVNTLNSSFSCPSPSSAILTHQDVIYSHNVSCGKKCSTPVNSHRYYYTCTYCN